MFLTPFRNKLCGPVQERCLFEMTFQALYNFPVLSLSECVISVRFFTIFMWFLLSTLPPPLMTCWINWSIKLLYSCGHVIPTGKVKVFKMSSEVYQKCLNMLMIYVKAAAFGVFVLLCVFCMYMCIFIRQWNDDVWMWAMLYFMTVSNFAFFYLFYFVTHTNITLSWVWSRENTQYCCVISHEHQFSSPEPWGVCTISPDDTWNNLCDSSQHQWG